MDRRGFIRIASIGAAAGVVTPVAAFAECNDKMAGGVFYTKDAPGRWSNKVGGHLPSIESSKNGADTIVKVITAHEMNGFKHYIVKHVILDQDYKFVAETLFDPLKDKAPISEFNLGSYSGTVYALSVCNKHDTWLNSAEV